MPENALLSHDLFEGLHARVALVSDVELVDDYPSSVLSHARRQHRWVRGDWQILFWLFPFVPSAADSKRNTLPLIGRWKILDNLRRSLVPPRCSRCSWPAGSSCRARAGLDGAVVAVVASQLLPDRRQAADRSGRRSRSGVPSQPAARRVTTLAQVALSLTFWRSMRSTLHAIVLDAGAPRRHQAPAAGVGDRGGRCRQGRRPRRREGCVTS